MGYIQKGNDIYMIRFHRDRMKTKIPDIEKRQKILDRSRSLFLMRGVSSLTMEEIASLQGISKKTLYRYFPNKNALVSAAIEEKIAEVAQKIARIARIKDLSFLEKIREILRTVSRQMAELGEGLIRDLYYNQPELWARIDRYRQEHVFVIIEKLLGEGAKSGLIRRDIDGRLVPALFVTTISSVMNPEQFVKMTVSPVEFFEAVVKILFGGILTDKARRQFFRQEDAS
jgi:AcrR family transcriptional regulator